MAERYNKRFALESSLYYSGAPVIIAAGALLWDSYSKNMLAQLKLKSVSPDPISSLKLRILMLDESGEILEPPVEHTYRDLNVNRDDEFGRSTAIVLRSEKVRSFLPQILSVTFQNGQLWSGPEDKLWFPLPPRQTLEEGLGDKELAVQYQTRYGKDCSFFPTAEGDLWFCACGAVNLASESKCHCCRRALSALKDVNLFTLRSETADRLKVEQEQEEVERAESGERTKRNKKRMRLAGLIVPLLILAVGLSVTLPRAAETRRSYQAALALVEAGRYDEAKEAFAVLGNYKDSHQQVQWSIPYLQTMELLKLAEANDTASLSVIDKTIDDLDQETYGAYAAAALLYQAAGEDFAALEDYKDSSEQAKACKDAVENCRQRKLQDDYDKAAELLNTGYYSQASEIFQTLGSFEDSAVMAQEALYQKGLALVDFTKKYNCRNIGAVLRTSSDKSSDFLLFRSDALRLGQDCIADLRAACGKDSADIRLADEDSEETLEPMLEALAVFFENLNGYKDSAQLAEELRLSADFTRDFYLMLEDGDLHGAYAWLIDCEEDFEGRDSWIELLELYGPFCEYWKFYLGDPTLLPRTNGNNINCYEFSSRIILRDEETVLELSYCDEDGNEYSVALPGKRGDSAFAKDWSDGYRYYSAINGSDHIVYLQYDRNGNIISSVEYYRANQ